MQMTDEELIMFLFNISHDTTENTVCIQGAIMLDDVSSINDCLCSVNSTKECL